MSGVHMCTVTFQRSTHGCACIDSLAGHAVHRLSGMSAVPSNDMYNITFKLIRGMQHFR
jgi:hypothetical protein